MATDIGCPVVRSDVTCYWKDMWRRLDSMRHLRELCDVSLCTDDGLMFMAHSPVLAASSDVLRQLLIAAQAGSYGEGCSVVQVSNVTHDVLRITLDFIYGKTPTSRIDFELLQSGAVRLGLPGAYEYCSRRLTEECSGLWRELGSASALINTAKWSTDADRQVDVHSQSINSVTKNTGHSSSNDSPESPCSQTETYNDEETVLNSLFTVQNDSSDEADYNFDTSSPLCPSSYMKARPFEGMAEFHSVGSDNGFKEMDRPFLGTSKESSSSRVDVHYTPVVKQADDGMKEMKYVATPDHASGMCVPPDDDHHANLMSQMSFDDLTRVDECPHLRRLASNDCSSLVIPCETNPVVSDVGYEFFESIPPKKRHRKPLLLLNTPDEEVVTTISSNMDVSSFPEAVDSISPYVISDDVANHSSSTVNRSKAGSEFICKQSNLQSSLQPVGAILLDTNQTQPPVLFKSADCKSSPACNPAHFAVTASSIMISSISAPVSSMPGLLSTGGVAPAVCSSLYSALDVKPMTELASYSFTPFAINHSTDSILPTSNSSLGHSIIETSENMRVSSDINPKYNHLSGGMITGTSTGFCLSTSLDISSLISRAAVSASAPVYSSLSSVMTTTTSSTGLDSSCRHSAYISLDDVSAVLKANGFTEKMADNCGKENGYPPIANRSDVISTSDRICSFCQKVCKTERQLISHIRTTHSTPIGDKLCAECSLSFVTVADLGLHLETEHARTIDSELSLAMARLNGNACYIQDCTYQNPLADALQRHLNQRHNVGQPTIECPTCSRAYFSNSQLNRHTIRAHPSQTSVPNVEDNSNGSTSSGSGSGASMTSSTAAVPRSEQLACSDCGEVLASSYKLQIHQLRAHSKGKLFSCHDCSFKSPRKKDVQAHMLSQHGTAPPGVHVYSCSICTYKCIDKNRFEEHEAMHNGIPRYRCTMCTRVYTTRRGLRTHIKYHSSDRPHSCTTCGASFKVRSKLADHVKLVHIQKGLKPFVCGYCGHATALRGNCNQHIRKSHPNQPLVVVDRLAAQRRTVKDYDYAGIGGAGIEEYRDLRAAGWIEPSTPSSMA